MIYDLALQDILDDTIMEGNKSEDQIPEPSIVRCKLRPFSPFIGALALPQTNRKLRHECLYAMSSLAEAKVNKASDNWRHWKARKTQNVDLGESYPMFDAITNSNRLAGLIGDLFWMEVTQDDDQRAALEAELARLMRYAGSDGDIP